MIIPRIITIGLTALSLSHAQDNASAITAQDADGNVYHSVKIGNQIWTVENLKTTKYNDGTPIPLVTREEVWKEQGSPAYCWYNNDSSYKDKYGALYNWQAVKTGKLAPKGWHVPSDAEWTELEEYLINNGYNWDGSKEGNKTAKSLAAKTDWGADLHPGTVGNDISTNDRSGFSALPAGFRNLLGDFSPLSYFCYWWSATEGDNPSYAWFRYLYCALDHPYRNISLENCGFSVRLLKG